MDELCGNCKHWHENETQKYKLKVGICDKIPNGTKFDKDYIFWGETFEDECYDDEFNCWEEKENEENE